jgi:hypothetical protein
MPPSKKSKEESSPEVKSSVFIFSNGDKYEGEFRQLPGGGMERCGVGTHTSADGTVYSGHWANDRMNKSGRIQFSNGACYEGGISDNQFHGHGRYTWPNGSFFQGTFVNNRMEGSGEFTDTDGQLWTGEFYKNQAPGLRFKLKM